MPSLHAAAALAWHLALLAAQNGEGAENHVDTDGMGGLSLWLADLYNAHHVLYALLVVGVLVGGGAMIGYLVEHFLDACGWGTQELESTE